MAPDGQEGTGGEGRPLCCLTPAEHQVTALLAGGMHPKEIASHRGTSLATVRTQLKHAKRKTRTRTLSELAALLRYLPTAPPLAGG